MRTKLLFLFLLLIPACLMARSRLVRSLARGESQCLVVYGTSIESNKNGQVWVAAVSSELDRRFSGRLTLHNAGKSGENSAWALENLQDSVLAREPDAVILEFAANDAVDRFGISVEKCRKNTLELIARIKQARPRCEIILMTACGWPLGDNARKRPELELYNDVYRQIASQQKLLLIDVGLGLRTIGEQYGDNAVRKIARDGVHPSLEGAMQVFHPSMLGTLLHGKEGKGYFKTTKSTP